MSDTSLIILCIGLGAIFFAVGYIMANKSDPFGSLPTSKSISKAMGDNMGCTMVHYKDFLMTQAITYVIGSDWTAEDVIGRCTITRMGKIEFFNFDGTPLIEFGEFEIKTEYSAFSHHRQMVQPYRFLFNTAEDNK